MNERQKQMDELAEQFFNACNAYSEREIVDALKDRLDRQHRTIIQSSMTVLKDLIEHYAEYHTADLRNADSLEWAKKVAQNKTAFRYI